MKVLKCSKCGDVITGGRYNYPDGVVCAECGEGGSDTHKWLEKARGYVPDLIQLAIGISRVGEGNAPSVGYMTDLVRQADAILNKIK